MFKRILIAIDDSPPAARALESGVSLAGELGGDLAIAHVVDTGSAFHPELGTYDERLLQELRRSGQLLLRAAVAQVPGGIQAIQMLLEGDPAETIIEAAKQWRADVIVLGSDSRGRLAHFLLGSTADSVIRRAPCPVLTVRQQTEVKPRRAAALQI
jgi:nucleotide-binding universal stress UspA family protein